MRDLLAPVGAVLGGLILAMLLIAGLQLLSSAIYPLPAGIDPLNPNHRAEFEAFMMQAPLAMYLVLLGIYLFAAFAGGALAGYIYPENKRMPALIIGMILTMAGIANAMQIPQPVWFSAVSLCSFFPAAWIGSHFVKRKAE